MKLTDFLRHTNLNKSLLIGYYGGGNYGDELLLEVLGNMLMRQGVSDLTITYQRPETYGSMHRDFGFNLVDIHSRAEVARAALKSKKILIGGGGLWGVDMNANTLLLSIFLFVSRWALGKKIYLLGVGYYNSTTRQGRMAAWLAGKAANLIIARDSESVDNFRRISKHVFSDYDIAWNTNGLDLAAYGDDTTIMEQRMPVGGKTLIVALRRPQAKRQQSDFSRYNNLVKWLVQANPKRPIIVVMLESETKDPGLYEEARSWRRKHKRLRIIEAPYNPLTLFLYIKKNSKRLAVIAPQLHLIMTAHLCGVPFLPMVYDNKVAMLLDQIGVPKNGRLSIKKINGEAMQKFANNFFGGGKQ